MLVGKDIPQITGSSISDGVVGTKSCSSFTAALPLSYLGHTPISISALKPEHEALRREPVLICFTISINYQVNEIPAHSLGTSPHLFGLLTAAGAVSMFSSRGTWQGILSLALTSRIIPFLFQHPPLEFILRS